MVETAKVTLVTVIAASELEDRLVADLRALGVPGYTIGKVDGRGTHGERMAGFFESPNLRVEMLVRAAVARAILERIAANYADRPIIAYVHDVEAIPREHFA
jgi:hypothetical protein